VLDYVFRRTEPAGIIQNLLFHAVRTRPDLRQKLERKTIEFLRDRRMKEELEHIRKYLKSEEYTKARSLKLKHPVAGQDHVKRTVA